MSDAVEATPDLQVKPGRHWYLLPILLFLGATAVALYLGYGLYLGVSNPGDYLTAPGSMTLELSEGSYALWHEFRGERDGVSYDVAETPPDTLNYELHSAAGELVPFSPRPESDALRQRDGDTARLAIGSFDVFEPGEYVFTVSGESEPRTFVLGLFDFSQVLRDMLLLLSCFFVGTLLAPIIGGGLMIVRLVRLRRLRVELAPE